jgi:hypothetical protein
MFKFECNGCNITLTIIGEGGGDERRHGDKVEN